MAVEDLERERGEEELEVCDPGYDVRMFRPPMTLESQRLSARRCPW